MGNGCGLLVVTLNRCVVAGTASNYMTQRTNNRNRPSHKPVNKKSNGLIRHLLGKDFLGTLRAI